MPLFDSFYTCKIYFTIKYLTLNCRTEKFNAYFIPPTSKRRDFVIKISMALI